MIIEHLNGERFDLSKLGFPTLKVGPPDNVYDSENIKGRPGRNRTMSYHGVRKIQLKMKLQAKDEMHTFELEEALAEIFDNGKPFYVYRQVAQPYEFEFPGQSSFRSALDQLQWTPLLYKRWFVERINNDAIEWDGLRGQRVLELETVDLPYAETPYNSLQLASQGKEWDVNLYAWGMGHTWDEERPRYTFDSNDFAVKNYGNVEVNPRYMPLKITVRGTFGSFVQIENLTTGDVFRFNGGLSSSDALILDGVNYLKNSLSVTGTTNKKLITLTKGNNQIRITGGTVSSVQFEFPFYYLQ